jgi:CRISPR-associated protein Cas1
MWRTLIITQGEKLGIKDNWLYIESSEEENKVPISDIYSMVIDNRQTYLTVGAITRLTDEGVHILFCDEKHNPVSVIVPLNTHYRPLNVIKKQLSLSDGFKDVMWQEIIKAKIENQAQVIKGQGCLTDTYNHLMKFRDEVAVGDKTNREGLSAKMFFRTLYGADFIRLGENVINYALNYGYAIIRSSVAKTLCAYGYNCVLGIHHISETNPFNLADDLMEPLRPLVDLWVDKNNDDLVDELTYANRKGLVNLVNENILIEGKNTKVRYAIDRYISSFTTAIEKRDVYEISIPKLSKLTLKYGEDGDD